MIETTDSPFVKLLLVYEQYKRSRISEESLTKIATKYSRKPKSLLNDVSSKYPDFKVPDFVHLFEVDRLKNSYPIPPKYIDLLPIEEYSEKYDPELDIRRIEFNAEKAFNLLKIIPQDPTCILYDNITKVRHLVFGLVDVNPSKPSLQSTERANKLSSEKQKHMFDTIAERSCSMNAPNDESLSMSPFSLLHKLMNSRVKVRVIIRRIHSVRGFVEGYLRAFDKHFNMVLTDVDEEYTPSRSDALAARRGVEEGVGRKSGSAIAAEGREEENWSSQAVGASSSKASQSPSYPPDRPSSKGLVDNFLRSKSKHLTQATINHHRHLPQLLVRGDNVVLVCAATISR